MVVTVGTSNLVESDVYLVGTVSALGDQTTITAISGDVLSGDPGHLVAGSQITINAGKGGVGTAADFIRVSVGSGGVSVNSRDDVFLIAPSGNLGARAVDSTTGNVTLTATAGSIIDATGDASADVGGSTITLDAPAGGIGTAAQSLGIDSDALYADSRDSSFITETSGDLNVKHVASVQGNTTLSSVDGDINLTEVITTGGTSHIFAFGSVLDAAAIGIVVIEAINVDLKAKNGSVGTAGKDVEIDSSNASPGVLTASAAGGVYVREDVGCAQRAGRLVDGRRDPLDIARFGRNGRRPQPGRRRGCDCTGGSRHPPRRRQPVHGDECEHHRGIGRDLAGRLRQCRPRCGVENRYLRDDSGAHDHDGG